MLTSKQFDGLQVLIAGRTIFRRRSRSNRSKKKEKPKISPSYIKALEVISSRKEISSTGLEIIRIAMASMKLGRLRAKLIFGLPNPQDTGLLYGYYHWAKAILSSQLDISRIEVEPVFDRETVEFDADVAIAVRIHRLFFPSLRFFLSKPIRQFWR